MSFIHCSCDCLYQNDDGYCGLEKAAEITNCAKTEGCLHYVPRRKPGDGSKKEDFKGIKGI